MNAGSLIFYRDVSLIVDFGGLYTAGRQFPFMEFDTATGLMTIENTTFEFSDVAIRFVPKSVPKSVTNVANVANVANAPPLEAASIGQIIFDHMHIFGSR